MATRTSATSGNWNAGGTWTGGIPGNGDSAIIAAGHTVTVTATQTVGTNTAGAAAITVQSTGALVVAAGITLIVRGDLVVTNGTYTQGAGAVLEFDASATTPTTTHYRFVTSNSLACIVSINGTAGARCTVRSNAGGGTGSFYASTTAWNFTATYTDFTTLGTASVAALQLFGVWNLTQCVFDTCGTIETYVESDTGTTKFVGVTTKNGVGAYSIGHGNTPLTLTTGTRLIQGCVFDLPLLHTFRDYTITDTVFLGELSYLSSLPWAAFSGNLLVWTANHDQVVFGDVVNSYCLANYATGNPHYLQCNATATIRGNIFEDAGSTADGDCVMPGLPSSPVTITVEHNLGLPNAGGNSTGTMFSLLGNANVVVNARHNTWYGGGQACGVVGETYAGHVGILNHFRDNLCWDVVPTTPTYKLVDYSSTVVDNVLSSQCHHNAGFNILAGNRLKGYHDLDFSSGSPGANDVDGVDPNFVDRTRDFAAWDASVSGAAGSIAHGLAELKKKNDPSGYNPAYTIAALVTWVKAGFVPQAAAMQAASDSVAPSNGWIGALAGVPVAAGWTLVAHTSIGSTGGGNVTTGAINTTGANLIIAAVGEYDGGISPEIVSVFADSKFNTWTRIRTDQSDGDVPQVTLYYTVPTSVGTGHTFGTTLGYPGYYPAIAVLAVSGALATPLDQHNGSESNTTTKQPGPVTPTTPNQLVVAAIGRNTAPIADSISGGFTIIEAVNPSAGNCLGVALAYLIQTTPAALANPTWTMTGADEVGASIATFKPGFVTPPPSGGGWEFIRSTRKSSPDAEDVTTDPMDTSTADFHVASISMYGDAPDTTIQDNRTLTWIPLAAADSGGATRLQLFYALGAGGVGHTFTTVCPSTNLPTICVASFKGAKLSGPFDVQSGTTSTSAATLAPGLVTPTQDNELIIAAAFLNPGFSINSIAPAGASPAGFTIVENGGVPSMAFAGALAYQIQTAAAAVNPTWTFSGATYCGAVAATFKAEPVSAVVDPGELTLLGVG